MKKPVISIVALLCYGFAFLALGLLLNFTSGSFFQGGLTLTNPAVHPTAALLTDLLLIILLMLLHRLVSSNTLKRWLTNHMPDHLIGIIYGLAGAIGVTIITQEWSTTDFHLWETSDPFLKYLFLLPHLLGWLLIGWTTFHIDHVDLLGLRPAFMLDQEYAYGYKPISETSGLHRFVRYPMQTGCLLIVWSSPVFSLDRLVLAGSMTIYILLGIWYEEKDMAAGFGRSSNSKIFRSISFTTEQAQRS